MFFTDVNKFTLTCDLNFQKRKKKTGERKEGRGEEGIKKIHQKVSAVHFPSSSSGNT